MRSSAASTPATSTSATSGAPTPACSPPCTCWPRWAARTRPLSELLAEYTRYVASGEINSTVDDQAGRIAAVEQASAGRDGVEIDELDGLTVDARRRAWFNVRPSNTEPLLRLNVEAADEPTMAAVRDEMLALIRADGSALSPP